MNRIMFKVTIDPEGSLSVDFKTPNGSYEKGLNRKQWRKEMAGYAEDLFNDGDVATCPKCGDDVNFGPRRS